MVSWLRGTTWFQRIALVLLIATVGVWTYVYATAKNTPTELFIPAGFIAFLAFRKQLLWRVRNRLVITYFLFGVVPVFLIFWLLELTAILVLGQFAAERVREDLEARINSVHVLTQDLMLAASHNGTSELLDEIRRREPRLGAVVRANGEAILLPSAGAAFSAAPDWIAPGFRGLFESGGRYYLGASLRPLVDAFHLKALT